MKTIQTKQSIVKKNVTKAVWKLVFSEYFLCLDSEGLEAMHSVVHYSTCGEMGWIIAHTFSNKCLVKDGNYSYFRVQNETRCFQMAAFPRMSENYTKWTSVTSLEEPMFSSVNTIFLSINTLFYWTPCSILKACTPWKNTLMSFWLHYNHCRRKNKWLTMRLTSINSAKKSIKSHYI